LYLGTILKEYKIAKVEEDYKNMTTQEGVEYADIVKHAPSDASQSHNSGDILSPFTKDKELPF
jgi:hypothetical protein